MFRKYERMRLNNLQLISATLCVYAVAVTTPVRKPVRGRNSKKARQTNVSVRAASEKIIGRQSAGRAGKKQEKKGVEGFEKTVSCKSTFLSFKIVSFRPKTNELLFSTYHYNVDNPLLAPLPYRSAFFHSFRTLS